MGCTWSSFLQPQWLFGNLFAPRKQASFRLQARSLRLEVELRGPSALSLCPQPRVYSARGRTKKPATAWCPRLSLWPPSSRLPYPRQCARTTHRTRSSFLPSLKGPTRAVSAEFRAQRANPKLRRPSSLPGAPGPLRCLGRERWTQQVERSGWVAQGGGELSTLLLPNKVPLVRPERLHATHRRALEAGVRLSGPERVTRLWTPTRAVVGLESGGWTLAAGGILSLIYGSQREKAGRFPPESGPRLAVLERRNRRGGLAFPCRVGKPCGCHLEDWAKWYRVVCICVFKCTGWGRGQEGPVRAERRDLALPHSHGHHLVLFSSLEELRLLSEAPRRKVVFGTENPSLLEASGSASPCFSGQESRGAWCTRSQPPTATFPFFVKQGLFLSCLALDGAGGCPASGSS